MTNMYDRKCTLVILGYRIDPTRAAISLGAIIVAVMPFYVSVVPPMTDVSQHVLVAHILRTYYDPIYRFADYFEILWTGAPTELFYRFLSTLQQLTGPYADARIYLSLWVVALCGSVWFLARAQKVDNPWASILLVLPLASCWYVYMGFLPFLMTLPLFGVTVSVWLHSFRLILKIPLLWILLLTLYSFHIVGACAAALVIGVSAVLQTVKDKVGMRPTWTAIVAGMPLAVAIASYLYGDAAPSVTVQHDGLLTNIVHTLRYTCASLSRPALFIMLGWVILLGLATLLQWNTRGIHAWILVSVGLLSALSVVLPTSLGALWPAGPRLFLFALILLASSLSWSPPHHKLVALGMLVIISGLSFANSLKARELDQEFRVFLSGTQYVALGSKVLPILVDPSEGARSVSPFWSLAAAYTITRGGANPYVFALPYIKTGASPLRYRRIDEFGYAFLFDRSKTADSYRGVSRNYDYIVVWGEDPSLHEILEQELRVIYRDRKLRIYESIRASR